MSQKLTSLKRYNLAREYDKPTSDNLLERKISRLDTDAKFVQIFGKLAELRAPED